MTTTKQWTRTVQAAKAEESSAWSMIWAMAEEAFDRDPTYKNISSGRVIEDIRLELMDAGVNLAFDTIKQRAIVGKVAHSAIKRDSDTLRSVPWSVVYEGVKAGATAEAIAAFVRESSTRPTATAMHEHFRANVRPGGTGSATLKYSDDKYLAALAVIASHTAAAQAGEYLPSAMARLGGVLLGQMLVGQAVVPDNWDEALTDLMAAEEGAG